MFRRKFFPILSFGFIAAGAACVVVAFIAPLDQPILSAPSGVRQPARAATTAPSLSDFEPVFALDLRRPLIDAPKTDPAADELTADSPLSVRLTGTIIEPGHSVGIFSTGLTKTVIRHVGEEVNGVEVLELTSDSATLRYQGQLRQLKLEKTAISPAPVTATPSSANGS
jgi:hypothetical protein